MNNLATVLRCQCDHDVYTTKRTVLNKYSRGRDCYRNRDRDRCLEQYMLL